MTWLMIAVVVAADLIVAIGDVAARKWAPVGGMNRYLMAAVVCYLVVSSLWLVLLRQVGELGKSSILWVASGAIVPVLVGHFLFGEEVPWNLKLSMAYCVAAMGLASIK